MGSTSVMEFLQVFLKTNKNKSFSAMYIDSDGGDDSTDDDDFPLTSVCITCNPLYVFFGVFYFYLIYFILFSSKM